MKKFFYLFCAGTLFLAGGCSDDESGGDRRIVFADIVDAECLYLTGKSGDTRASDEDEVDPALYKVTFDGTTEKVIFTDENGKSVDTEVHSFRRLSDEYIYVNLELKLSYYSTISKSLLIRRSDGGVFEVSHPDYIYLSSDTPIQTDSSGNLYYCSSVYGDWIGKIYTQGNELYRTSISGGVNATADWLVDRRGNVLINSEFIRFASGEFTRYDSLGSHFYAWNDPEGFYGWDWDYSSWNWDYSTGSWNGTTRIMSIHYCRPTYPRSTSEEIKKFEFDRNDDVNCNNVLVYTDKTVLFGVRSKYRIDIYNKDRIELHEMEPHTLPDGISFEYYGQKYPHTEKYFYGMSRSEIWRLSVETGEPEMLYKYDDEFEIKSMSVRNGIITFKAFYLRDNTNVIAEIYPDKTVKVLESANGDNIIQFERLN